MIISRTLKNGNPRITLHPLWRVTHSMTSVSRWPGVMCCGNGYLLWERVNKAGKTHKIPCVNRVWAGGCEEMGLGEREREREPSEPWVWWQVELVVVVTFALGWAETEWAPVWSVIQILTVSMTCHPCSDHLSGGQLSSLVHQATITQSS